MAKRMMFIVIIFGFAFCFVAARDNKQGKAAWEKNRLVFNAYFASPSTENAEYVLLVLPDRIDVRDFETLNKTMDIFYREHWKDLYDLVRKGDRLALRIAFKAVQLMDGIYQVSLDSIIGSSIIVAPTTFLEEAMPFVKKQSEWFASFDPPWKFEISRCLGPILGGNINIEETRRDVIEKEIKLRIEALATVKRRDLLEVRDICLDILKKRLNPKG